MSDTLTASPGRVRATRMVLNLAAYERLAARKGATTAEQRRELTGISRSTEWRWRHGITDPSGRRARAFVKALEGTQDELFVEVQA